MDKKIITRQIDDLTILSSLANAYAEISSGRMKKTRDSVVLARDFITEIQAIFKDLQESYRSEFLKLARKKGYKKGEKLTFLSHNGRKVAVFLSTNVGFYGNITQRVFQSFSNEFEKENLEATVVGKLGLAMFLQAFPGKSYTYFEFPDYGDDKNVMGELIKHLVNYDEIRIYYGKFRSIINQYPDKVVITSETDIGEKSDVKHTKYLFEPSLEEIIMFFETEMFSSLFEHVMSESQLAKLASRMLAMDQAGERIKESLAVARTDYTRLVHYMNNKKQLEYLSSVIGR